VEFLNADGHIARFFNQCARSRRRKFWRRRAWKPAATKGAPAS